MATAEKTLQKGMKNLVGTISSYNPEADLGIVEKACRFAEEKHDGQTRSSGEPYMTHPLEVATILTKLRMDVPTIVAALLHDTVEDTSTTLEEVDEYFGSTVRDLVDGVTKIGKITFRTKEEKQAENFRKMLIAMSKDIRVILIKLADRTHNMRTLSHLKAHKQREIAKETLEIYAPLANRLGISWMKSELEDLCLRYLKPDIYFRISQKVNKRKDERENHIDEVCLLIQDKIREYDLRGEVTGRPKNFYSIYKKMESRGVDYNQIHDIIAFRIIVDNITECYKALGVIHATWIPIPGRFKDYIAMPKPNNYQSLHTTVIGPKGERVEIQIRTHEMHRVAEEGIAAHWAYKQGVSPEKAGDYGWLKKLLEFNQEVSDPTEFMESVKGDLFAGEIFVFTPAGDVKEMPHGATPLDFAYSIHTEVGNRCIGAKSNGKIVPLNYRLKSGDTIEILTSKSQSPSKDWLRLVKSSGAKSKIRSFIKKQERERARGIGKTIFEKELRELGISLNRVIKQQEFQEVLSSLGKSEPEDIYATIGYGKLEVRDILKKMPEFSHLVQKEHDDKKGILSRLIDSARQKVESQNPILVNDMSDVMVRFCKHCQPIPGDTIVGFVTRGRGITVHTNHCPKVLDADEERRIDVGWSPETTSKRPVRIKVLTVDEPGILASLTKSITQNGFNITHALIRTMKYGRASCVFEIQVSDKNDLSKAIGSLMARQGVLDVERVFGKQ